MRVGVNKRSHLVSMFWNRSTAHWVLARAGGAQVSFHTVVDGLAPRREAVGTPTKARPACLHHTANGSLLWVRPKIGGRGSRVVEVDEMDSRCTMLV